MGRFRSRAAKAGLVALALLCAGCQARPGSLDYRTSGETLSRLWSLRDTSQKAEIVAFAGPRSRPGSQWMLVQCPWLKERTARSIDYAGYVREALEHDLGLVGLTAPPGEAALSISGELTRLSLDHRPPFGGTWTIGLRLASSNGATADYLTRHEFDFGALTGVTACENAVRSWRDAVEELMEKVSLSEQLPALLR